MIKNCIYFCEGPCDISLLNALRREPSLILPGRMKEFNVIQNQITIGEMMMISYVLGQLSGPVNELIKFSRVVQDANLSNKRLAEIYDKPDECHAQMVSLGDCHFENGIRFENVCFRHEGTYNKDVLRHINLTIPLGKTTAIVGSSGSGKTSLIKLLLGFYYRRLFPS